MKINNSYAIFWDLDGTITNTGKTLAQALRLSLEKHGYQLTDETEKRLTGLAVPYGFNEVLIDALGNDIKSKFESIWAVQEKIEEELVAEIYKDGKLFLHGAKEMLEYQYRQGTIMKIGSASNGSRLRMVLKVAGIAHMFNEIAASENVTNHKPAPDVWVHLAKNLDKQIERIYVIGDTPYDFISGHEFGSISKNKLGRKLDVRPIWVPDAIRPTEEHAKILKMCKIFKNLSEVNAHITSNTSANFEVLPPKVLVEQ